MEKVVVTSEEELRRTLREIVREVVRTELAAWRPADLPIKDVPSPADAGEPLISREQMAEILHITLPTLTDWVKRGLPRHKRRRRVLFLKSEALAWMKDNPQ